MLVRGANSASRLILATVIATGCSSSGSDATDTPQGSVAPAASDRTPASEAPSEAAPPAAAFEAIELTGKGDKIAKFTIPEGSAAIADATHKGERNFAIVTIDAAGEQLDLLVNTIGNYRGTVLFDETVASHSAAFEITADGTWGISIKSVTEAPTWDPSAALKGTGDSVYQVSPPSSGLVTLDVVNKGEGNFAVIAFSANDSDLLVNEIGDYRGQVLLPDGTVLVEITSEGAWAFTPG